MLGWIAGFISRWAGLVPAAVRDLIHWTVHALASVVYTVFGHVGAAWHDLERVAAFLELTVAHALAAVYWHLRQIVLVDIPQLWGALLADVKHLWAGVSWVWDRAQAITAVLRHDVLSWLDEARRWVLAHVWAPLKAQADDIWDHVTRWAYPAWYLVTHPDKLAAVLGDALVTWLEANAWRVARGLGTFLLALLVHNLRRVLLLAEDVISAVL